MTVVKPVGGGTPTPPPPTAAPVAAESPADLTAADAVTTAPVAVAVAAEAQTKAVDDLGVPGVFPLDALGSIQSSDAAGQIFRLDNGFLDALRLQVRPIADKDGKPGYDIQFKISSPSRASFAERLDKKGAKKEPFQFFTGKPEEAGGRVRVVRDGTTHALGSSFYSHKAPDTSSSPSSSLRLSGEGWQLDFIPADGPIALRGNARLTLHGDDAACAKALAQALEQAGLQAAFAPVTAGATKRYMLMRLLWRVAPKQAQTLAAEGPLTDLSVSKVEAALKKAGVSAERAAALKYEEVAPGHFTVIDPVGLQAMKQAGLRYCYSTVKTPEHVLSILTDGQKATLTRWSEGLIVSGMSSMADVGSGGAQGVFSRIVTSAAKDKSWTGRTYKILLKPDLLARADVWGWPGDFYGRSWQLTERNFGEKLLEDIDKNGYTTNNEVISPVGNAPSYIAQVVATTEPDRKKLIQYLEGAGYSPPDGKSVEAFVKLAPKIDPALLG